MKIRRIFADQDFLLSTHWDGQIFERAHTLQELTKLDMCREFLKAEGIFDEEGMLEFLEIEI